MIKRRLNHPTSSSAPAAGAKEPTAVAPQLNVKDNGSKRHYDFIACEVLILSRRSLLPLSFLEHLAH